MSYRDCKACVHERQESNTYPCNICVDCSLFFAKSENETGPNDKPANDPVNRPEHYTQGGIECIDAIDAAVTGLTGMEAVCTAQIIKCIWRWKRKNGLEDLRKAGYYLGRLIKEAEEG